MDYVTVGVLLFLYGRPQNTDAQPQPWEEDCGLDMSTSSVEVFGAQGRMIVGGHDAKPGQVPWQVSLRYADDPFDGRNHFCGAVLIARGWILTAAHCVTWQAPSDVAAVLGEHDTRDPDNHFRSVYHVTSIVLHPEYSQAAMFDADIALLRLAELVQYTERVSPVCAPRLGETYVGHESVVSGWGRLQWGTSLYPDILQVVTLPVPSNTDCQQSLGDSYTLTQGMVCAGNIPEYNKDACQNDSGGPMTVLSPDRGRHELVGLVSWGLGCASGSPGVYTRVSHYMDWIHQHVTTDTNLQ